MLFTTEGKDKTTAAKFLENFQAKRGKPDKVSDITCDMCHGYRNAVESFNHFDTRKTNAFLEGFNFVIGLIRRKARDFKNVDNFW